MGSAVIAKVEGPIWNNSGTTLFTPPMTYASCQMFSMTFLVMSLFILILGLVDKTVSVLLIFIIGFFSVSHLVLLLLIHVSDI